MRGEGYRLIFIQKSLDGQLAEVGKGEAKGLVIPVPPGKAIRFIAAIEQDFPIVV